MHPPGPNRAQLHPALQKRTSQPPRQSRGTRGLRLRLHDHGRKARV